MRGNSLAVMAWRNLWRNRRRTILTLSSIVFGVFLSVLFTAMQDQNWADTINLAARLSGGHVTIEHPEYLDAPKLSLTIRDTGRLKDIAGAEVHVDRVAERISGQTMLSTAGDSFGAGFIAIDPAQDDEATLSILEGLVEGEMFDATDARGIILGARLAENLGIGMGKRVVYTMTDVNGDIVAGLGRVSGLIRTGSPSVDGGIALLPIDAVRELLGYAPDEATQLAVFIDDQRRTDLVAENLQNAIGASTTALPWHRAQPELAAFIAMKVGGAWIMEAIIMLLVAAGIFNTIFVGVMERMREFGILRAIGWSPGQLGHLVITESALLAAGGIALGLLVTAGPYWYLNRVGFDLMGALTDGQGAEVAGIAMTTRMYVDIYPENALMIGGAALCATLLSGVYPAWKAGHVDPTETIRLV